MVLKGRNIKMSEARWKKIEELAKEEGLSVNAMVSQLIGEALIYREIGLDNLRKLTELTIEQLKEKTREKTTSRE